MGRVFTVGNGRLARQQRLHLIRTRRAATSQHQNIPNEEQTLLPLQAENINVVNTRATRAMRMKKMNSKKVCTPYVWIKRLAGQPNRIRRNPLLTPSTLSLLFLLHGCFSFIPRSLHLLHLQTCLHIPPTSSLSFELNSQSISLSIFASSAASRFIRNIAVTDDFNIEEEGNIISDEAPPPPQQEQSFSADLKLFVGNLSFKSIVLSSLSSSKAHETLRWLRGFGFVTISSVSEVKAASQQFNVYTWTAQHIMINRSTTVSLSVFDAQADQLKQNILAIGVAKVIVATSINPKFVGGNIRCGKGRLYLDATSGIHFYFDHEVAASQRLFQELYSKPEKDTTSAKQYHGVKKLEKVSLGELNNYILESPPQVLEFLCKAKIASLETTNGWYRVELLVEAGDDKSLFVAFDSAMTKLTGIRAAEVVME
ncbi:hypothetical protein IGI04_006717 [Brassica rapa subsp. trilocularis]|uniref:RRM domain-containing protein n=2 Tax=Brassica rapa subsp. trilocularis TaxID=1813537 RepID=A0ABQ7NI32_BRACM|nr:hypothetical protein IGI04_006717 [Brassica rapa subsp. trilocularis]